MLFDVKKYAFTLGRFQPFHIQHLQYLLAAAERGGHLIVGITNPSRISPPISTAAPHRSDPEANPFSYFDRYRMIRDTLLEEGMAGSEFSIVPAALGAPTFLDTLPPVEHMVCFITINDSWGEEKRRIIEEMGIQVEVLWERTNDPQLITGTMVRARIRADVAWDGLVPAPAASIVREVLHGRTGELG